MNPIRLLLICWLVASVQESRSIAAIFASEAKILEGEVFARDPMFDSVGWVGSPKLDDLDGQLFLRGSGILIEPDWVLTNGHVVLNGAELFPRLNVGFDDDILAADPLIEYRVSETFVFPGYSDFAAPGTAVDLALMKLEQPVPDIVPAERFRGEDVVGRLIRAAGYGNLGVFPDDAFNIQRGRENDLTKRAGEDNIDHFETFPRLSSFMAIRFNQFSGQNPLEWASSPGDSGGGWFSEIDGRNQLVGVNSYSAGLGDSGAVRVSLFNDWIDATIAANSVPEPGGGSLLVSTLLVLAAKRRRVT